MTSARAEVDSTLSNDDSLEVDPSTIPGLKFYTPRDESFPTIGHRQARWARIWLGRELMPWQRLMLNVFGEYDPETLLPRYTTHVDTVQRRAGKSAAEMIVAGERSFAVPGHLAWYTAQTGQDARIEFLKFHDKTLDGTAASRLVRLMRGRGEEVMLWPNKSEHRCFPPSESKLHGKDSDRVTIDEAWWFDLPTGLLLMQAIAPTQLTRRGAITALHSAGGTANSTFLADWVARGRRADRTFAYFELGCPDDLDMEDIEAVAEHHPAFGYTVDLAALHSMREKFGNNTAGWARAAGNRWTEIVGGAIGRETWEAVRYADPLPGTGRLGFGTARAEDGSHVVVATAEQIAPGLAVAEVVDVIPPVGAAEHVIAWAAGDPLAVDPSGPSEGLADDLARLRAPQLTVLTGRQAGAATTDMLDAIDPASRAYRFRQHPTLDAGAKVAATRPRGDGGRAWSRTSATTSIAAIEAVCWALYASKSGPQGVPMVIG